MLRLKAIARQRADYATDDGSEEIHRLWRLNDDQKDREGCCLCEATE